MDFPFPTFVSFIKLLGDLNHAVGRGPVALPHYTLPRQLNVKRHFWGAGLWRWPALQDEWLAVTGDSHYIDCRPVVASRPEDLLAVCCEVYKYAVQFAALDPAERLEAHRVVAGPPRRMLSRCLGEFYGLGIDSAEARREWRAEEELAGAGPGDCRRFGFNSVNGLYELLSFQAAVRIPVGRRPV